MSVAVHRGLAGVGTATAAPPAIEESSPPGGARAIAASRPSGPLPRVVSADADQPARPEAQRCASVEQVLRRDPACAYPDMDAQTKARYRAVLEEWACRLPAPAVELALLVLQRAAAAAQDPGATVAARHVGYYLIGPGAESFEAELNVSFPAAQRARRWVKRHPNLTYNGLVTALFAAAAGSTLAYAAQERRPWPLLLLVAGLGLPILLDLALLVARGVLVKAFPRRELPKMAFQDIPDSCRTLVVVPTMLSSPVNAHEQVQRLERLAALHPYRNLRFALLSDFPDAPQRVTPEDEAVVAAAAAAVESLNQRHRDALGDKFFVLHRERRWNASEGCWMGWERKRGKLEELNRLLRVLQASTSYRWILGGFARSYRFQYVFTLDEDMWLPAGHLLDLVRTAAHPLNRPVYDGRAHRVVEGYGIMAARVRAVRPQVRAAAGKTTRYSRLLFGVFGTPRMPSVGTSGHTTMPPPACPREFSFDVFGTTEYYGKGLYDVDAFRAALDGAFPENAVLSHDHLEGYYARTGHVYDALMVESFPLRYATRSRQLHRWMRGDWQVLPWLLPQVREASGRRRHNPLVLGWRLEILRRLVVHLHAPASVLLLLVAWLTPPGAPVVWMMVALLMTLTPLALLAAVTCVHCLVFTVACLPMLLLRAPVHPMAAELGRLLRMLANHGLRAGFAVAVLADSAALAVDGISRCLWRLLVSRRSLLEWNAQRQVEIGAAGDLRRYLRSMWPSVAWGLLALGLVAVVRPPNMAWAAPVAGLWVVAPCLVWWLDRPPKAVESSFLGTHRLAGVDILSGKKIAR